MSQLFQLICDTLQENSKYDILGKLADIKKLISKDLGLIRFCRTHASGPKGWHVIALRAERIKAIPKRSTQQVLQNRMSQLFQLICDTLQENSKYDILGKLTDVKKLISKDLGLIRFCRTHASGPKG